VPCAPIPDCSLKHQPTSYIPIFAHYPQFLFFLPWPLWPRLLPCLLIPRNLLPYVSAVLTEAEHLLDRAESIGVIPQPNDYRPALTLYEAVVPLPTDRHLTDQHSCAGEFLQIRMESHRAPGIF
jgi:hypothetical protein